MKDEMGSKQCASTIIPVPVLPSPLRILIVRSDRLGDVMLTLPMARAIKKALPDAQVTFLAREYTRSIVERCTDVDEVRTMDEKTSFWKLVRLFRQMDVAFFPSPRFSLALAAFIARVPKRVGTAYRWYSFLFSTKIYEHRKTAEHHEAEYNLRMLTATGITADLTELPTIELHFEEKKSVDEWLRKTMGADQAKFAVLHCTNGGSTQSWPVQEFIEVGRAIIERYGINIVLTGTAQDANILNVATASIGAEHAIPFVGHSLLELAALLKRASIIITVGTGPGHLAAALNAPTVGIFPLPLPISKERWGFRGTNVINLSPAPISECPNCQHCTCMERMDTENVMNAVHTLFI